MIISQDFKKPLNIVFLFLAIAGLASGYYFYYAAKKIKDVSYKINEPSSLIYDSKNSSSAIKVIEKDSIPIKDNVYILTGIIWNSGNLPISANDIRQSLSLNLMSCKKILDFKIVKQTDPVIAEFKLTKENNKSIGLSWKYFDPGYAFIFQIIYTGYENPQFELGGKILDIVKFKKVDAKNPDYYYMLLASIGMFVFLIIGIAKLKKNKLNSSSKAEYFYDVMSVVIPVLMLISFTIILISKFNNPIPLDY